MDYSGLYKSLVKEVLSGKQYKKLSLPIRILAYIAVFPFTVLSVFMAAFFYVYNFSFNVVSSGVNYLEQWLKNTKKGVAPLTEAVIYFIALPLIFFNHVLLSFFAVNFFILWFFSQCTFYVASLGGIKWQPYVTQADFEDVDAYRVSTHPYAAAFHAISSVALLVAAILLSVLEEEGSLFALYLPYVALVTPLVYRQSKDLSKVSATKKNQDKDELPEF